MNLTKLEQVYNKLAGIILLVIILVGIGFGIAYKYYVKPLKAELQQKQNQIEELLKK
jgi:F0F1-type ATP synthase membrane subunit b/b'